MKLWEAAIEELEWPSAIRGPMMVDRARELLDPEAEDGGEPVAVAYLLAAYVAQLELSDGRGGSPLYEAAEAFCAELDGPG